MAMKRSYVEMLTGGGYRAEDIARMINNGRAAKLPKTGTKGLGSKALDEYPSVSPWPFDKIPVTTTIDIASRIHPAKNTNHRINYQTFTVGEAGSSRRPDERAAIIFSRPLQNKISYKVAREVANIIEMNRQLDLVSRNEVLDIDPAARERVPWVNSVGEIVTPMLARQAMGEWTFDGIAVGQDNAQKDYHWKPKLSASNVIGYTVKGEARTFNIWGDKATIGQRVWLIIKRDKITRSEETDGAFDPWPETLSHGLPYPDVSISGGYRPFRIYPWVGERPSVSDLYYEDYGGVFRVGIKILVGRVLEDDVRASSQGISVSKLDNMDAMLERGIISVGIEPFGSL